jgi:hydroxyacyl-ACP dehydratase HTD2-like protein with hotdog domain
MRDYCQTNVSLFRFSALTFNAHKIHYARDWCQNVEGHRDCVVHGPLNLIHMLDLWRDARTHADPEVMPQSISYRAMSPLYVNEKYRAVMEREADGKDEWKTEIWDSYGNIGMRGHIVA